MDDCEEDGNEDEKEDDDGKRDETNDEKDVDGVRVRGTCWG